MSRAAARRSVLLAVVAAALALVGPMLFAPSAFAHDVLESTSPVDGSTVPVTPSQVTLTFDQPAFAIGSQVIVTGPSGNVAVGKVRIVDRVVTQQIRGGAPAGAYTVEWRVTSADGHPVDGQFGFSSQAPSSASPSGSVTPTSQTTQASGAGSGGSSNSWILPVVVLAVVWLGILAFALRRRQRPITPPNPTEDKRRRAREGR
jgi:hypothetical protein